MDAEPPPWIRSLSAIPSNGMKAVILALPHIFARRTYLIAVRSSPATASDLLPQGQAGRDQPSTPSRLNDSDRHAIATSIVTLMPRQLMEYPTIWLGRQPVLDDLHRG